MASSNVCSDQTWAQTHGLDVGVFGQSLSQTHSELHVGQLGLVVDVNRRVVLLGGQIDTCAFGVHHICARGDIDDTCLFRQADEWEQEVGEQEVAEVVGCHGHLHSLFIQYPRVKQHTRVINEDVDMREGLFYALREGFHRCSFGEVKWKRADASFGVGEGLGDVLNSRGIFLLIPTTKDDMMSVSKESSCCFKPNTSIATCDHNILGLHPYINLYFCPLS